MLLRLQLFHDVERTRPRLIMFNGFASLESISHTLRVLNVELYQ